MQRYVKKMSWPIAMLAMLALSLAGCGGKGEADLVGTWKVNSAAMQMPTSSGGDAKQKMGAEMAKAMLGNMSLELKADKTFVLNMMLAIEGNWTFADNNVTLTPTKMMGMDVSKMPASTKATQKPMVCMLSADGKQLTLQDSSGKPNPSGKTLTFDKQ